VKKLTRDQVASRKDKAVRFVRDVLDDPERADEIESESLDDYAERRKFQLLNPRLSKMAKRVQTRQELQDRIRELEEENESLQDQLDQVADIVAPMEEEEDDESEEEEDAGE
jgi:acyl carrier protein phosphodiesterase